MHKNIHIKASYTRKRNTTQVMHIYKSQYAAIYMHKRAYICVHINELNTRATYTQVGEWAAQGDQGKHATDSVRAELEKMRAACEEALTREKEVQQRLDEACRRADELANQVRIAQDEIKVRAHACLHTYVCVCVDMPMRTCILMCYI